MPTSTLTSKGQTTLPREIRQHLGLRAGDKIHFLIEAPGRVLLRPLKSGVRELRGALPRPKRPVSLDEMKAAIGLRGGTQ